MFTGRKTIYLWRFSVYYVAPWYIADCFQTFTIALCLQMLNWTHQKVITHLQLKNTLVWLHVALHLAHSTYLDTCGEAEYMWSGLIAVLLYGFVFLI